MIINGLSIEDELNTYLVANQLKPAATITLDITFYPGYNIKKRKKGLIIIYSGDLNAKIKKEDINKFENKLKEIGLEQEIINEEQNRIQYAISKNKECLNKLLNAKNNNEIGLALGFPDNAIKAFAENKTPYLMIEIKKAREKGINIPIWLAYISHVPEKIDLVNNEISDESKKQGEEYMNYIRKNNPELAKRVEDEFKESIIPSSEIYF